MPDLPTQPLNPPMRLLLGPGPSPVHPRIYRAMTTQVLGYADPFFYQVMEETKELMRHVFNTQNPLTFPVSGTGTAGMETAIANAVEAGDEVLVGIIGAFGQRLQSIAERHHAVIHTVEAEWGTALQPGQVEAALQQWPNTRVVMLVHGETSTGVVQPMDGIAQVVQAHGALLILDTVTSLSGAPVNLDQWGVDFAYSGTQKCLNAPPGLSPFSVSPRGEAAMAARKTPVDVWYLDMTGMRNYWGSVGRTYYHTPPTTMIYALREALAVVADEGLEHRFARHARNAQALHAGVTAMGLGLFVKDPSIRLPSLTTINIPDGADDAKTRETLRDQLGIDIAGGQGYLAGKVWRIGLMGYGSSPENVLGFMTALHRALALQGVKTDLSAGLAAAGAVLG